MSFFRRGGLLAASGVAVALQQRFVAPRSERIGAGASASSRTFEPCPEVACKSREELLAMFGGQGGAEGDGAAGGRRRRAERRAGGAGGRGDDAGAGRGAGGAGGAAAGGALASPAPSLSVPPAHGAGAAVAEELIDDGCPPDRQQLGACTWSLVSSTSSGENGRRASTRRCLPSMPQ